MNTFCRYGKLMRSLLPAFAVLCISWTQVTAQHNDKLKELKSIFDALKGLKTYSYEMDLHAVFPDGSKDKIHSEIYMDKANERLYYVTDLQVMLLNKKWFYQVEHPGKKVRVFDVTKYNKKYKDQLPELKEVFNTDAVTMFIDSFLVQYAKIKSYAKEGNIATFTLSFPDGSHIKEFVLKYDYDKQLPALLKLKVQQSEGDGIAEDGRKRKTITYDYLCSKYNKTIPEQLFNPHQFFEFKNGKVTLLKYKEYKLFTII